MSADDPDFRRRLAGLVVMLSLLASVIEMPRVRGHSVCLPLLPLAVLVALAASLPAQAQSADEIERREREARQSRERDLQRQAPEVDLQVSRAADFRQTDLPDEAICHRLDAIVLEGSQVSRFRFAQRYLEQYTGQCAGADGVGLIARRVGDLIIDRGYVTTRIGVPEQNISSGVLRLQVVPGVLREVVIEGDMPGYWKSALPIRGGDLINLRDIEQGLEQFKRVPTQDVSIDIAPGDQPGQSDLVIKVQRRRPVRGVLGIDDSGSRGTGRLQGNASVGWDNPLRFNDILTFGYGHDLVGAAELRGTRSRNAGYSLPWRHWQFDVGASRYDYHQTVTGHDIQFLTSGISRTRNVGLQRNLHRGQRHRSNIELRINTNESRSFVEQEELLNQRRNTTSIELALRQRVQWGDARLDLRLAQRRGVPWLGGQRDRPGTPLDYPTYQYRINTLDMSLDLPMQVGPRALFWSSEVRAQHSDDPLYGNEQFAIGSRYSVRGYDGEQPLVAERGVYWRNTLTLPLGEDISVYTGVDVGRIGGGSARYLPGRSLSGAVIGLRGGVAGVSWDMFTGRGLQAPRGISRDAVIGIQAAVSF